MKIRKILLILTIVVCLVGIPVLGVKAYKIIKGYSNSSESYKSLNKQVTQSLIKSSEESKDFLDTENPGESNNVEDLRSRFLDLKNINDDYCGWISIPNTNVNYPITTGDCNYYLSHDFYGNKNEYGCITTDDSAIEPFVDSITILHGHHMSDGSMFATLKLFKDKSFALSNEIYVELYNEIRVYDVFSVIVEEANKETYKSNLWGGELSEHLDYLKSKSIIDLSENLGENLNRILVLSTCSYESENYRLVICAVEKERR